MAYPEQERRRSLLEKLRQTIEAELQDGARLPLNLTLRRERLAELGEEMGLDRGRVEYLFMTLVEEGFVKARIASDRSEGFQHAILNGLTDRGLRLIGHLPPREGSLEDILERLSARS